MNVSIRLGHLSELEEILSVEREAGERFRPYGLLDPPDENDPTRQQKDTDAAPSHSDQEYRDAIAQNRLWIAEDNGKIVGFALAFELDNEGHLREVDVLQSHGRRGIGKALIQKVIEWCHANGYASITLTTFKDIPWNKPYYEKLGFKVIGTSNLEGELALMTQKERGTHKMARVAMRKIL